MAFVRHLRRAFASRPASALLSGSVTHSLIGVALGVILRRRIAHIHVAHGGPEPAGYQRKSWLNRVPGVSIVAVSQHAQRRLEAYGVDPRKIDVIPNFLPTERVESLDRPERKHRALHQVVVIGKVEPIKRIDLLLQAIDLQPELRTLHFRVVGDGPLLTELRTRASSYPNVEFAGFVEDVDSELAAADALLHCCPVEAGPLVVLEAMASGLPVLAPNAGGCKELVVDGDSGLLFSADDPADLAARLLELMRRSPEDNAAMGARARERLVNVFGQEARCDQYREFIERHLRA